MSAAMHRISGAELSRIATAMIDAAHTAILDTRDADGQPLDDAQICELAAAAFGLAVASYRAIMPYQQFLRCTTRFRNMLTMNVNELTPKMRKV